MFEHIDLKKGYGYGFEYHLYAKTDTLVVFCPEERLNEYDFEFGLCHEFTEATLRLVVNELENYWQEDGDLSTDTFHAVATLSLPRYDFVAHFHDFLESEFKR